MAFGNPAAGKPGTVQERNQYPLHSQRRENLPDRNEDEEPGTVLSCVIADAQGQKIKADVQKRKCRT